MLTEVKAYSSWRSAPTLLLSESGRPETDLIQIQNIDGLDPIKASVNTSPRGVVDGSTFIGTDILTRNIVLTLRPNPDWMTWTYEELRDLLYSYFMPKQTVRLVFYSDNKNPVEILGVVESAGINMFSKDQELLVSVICPDPYFVSVDPIVVTGQSIRADGVTTSVKYNGNIETGVKVKLSNVSGGPPTSIGIQIGDPETGSFNIEATVSDTSYFEANTVPLHKYVQNIDLNTGAISNLLDKIEAGSVWPTLQPGTNDFSVITDSGVQDWELSYYERFGGL